MTVYIKAYGPVTTGEKQTIFGEYLCFYDPEAFDGRGDASFTQFKHKAMSFETWGQAYEFTQRVPKAKPWREDGQPNRPLTAFTLEFCPE